jgi:sugar O-acyltransferase (sialic acid O-acetyltransferase NeuD family)
MADVVIFGTRDTASLAHFYLTEDSPHNVVGFTVHREFMPTPDEFEGLPVVPFEELETRFPPDRFSAFAPLSYHRMNRFREEIYLALKGRCYSMISYVSSRATRFSGTEFGENCFVLEDNTIQPFVTIGHNVVLWSGNHIGHHSRIQDHVFVTSHVVISGHCVVSPHCFLGVNATVKDGLTLAQGTLVGMGAIIGRDTQPWSVHKADATRASKISSADLNL